MRFYTVSHSSFIDDILQYLVVSSNREWPAQDILSCVQDLGLCFSDEFSESGYLNLKPIFDEVTWRYNLESTDTLCKHIYKLITAGREDKLLHALKTEFFNLFLCNYGFELILPKDISINPPFAIKPFENQPRLALLDSRTLPSTDELLGFFGAETFQNYRVLIKPNFVSNEPWPVTVDFSLFEAVLDTVIAAGASDVAILEMPSRHEKATNSHIEQAITLIGRKNKARWIEPTQLKLKLVTTAEFPQLYFPHFIPLEVLECDVIVSIANFKEHESVGFTGSVKNMVGLLPDCEKIHLHALEFEEMCAFILDLYQMLPIKACIVDARSIVSKAQQLRRGGKVVDGFGIFIGTDALTVDQAVLSTARKCVISLDNRPNYLDLLRFEFTEQ